MSVSKLERHALHDGSHALETQAGIDVLLLERNHRAILLAVKLCEARRFQYSRKRSQSQPGLQSGLAAT